MIGSGLRSYASGLGLEVKNGIAFGVYRGYMLTMEDGSGWKSVTFAARLAASNSSFTLQSILDDEEIKKAYRINNYQLTIDYVRVYLLDTIGTMKRVAEFVEFMCDRLDELAAVGASHCNKCGQPIGEGEGETVLVTGIARRMHRQCAEEVDRELAEKHEKAVQGGNIATGAIGALLGALVGAIPWAASLYFGWVVAILGLVIGVASKKGYELLHGKEGKIKILFIIVSAIIAVVVAQFAVLAISLSVEAAADTELQQIIDMLGGTVKTIIVMLQNDSEFLRVTLLSLGQGLLFAGLGIFVVLSNIAKKYSRKNTTVTRL